MPTIFPFSTAQTGFSLAASVGAALLTVVVTSSFGAVGGILGRGLAHDPAERQHVALRDVAHEVRDVLVGRLPDELLRRPELHDRAVAHDRDPVAEAKRLRQVVRDEEHRLARLELEPADLVLHVAADQRIEGAEGLVVEHHLRIDREGPREPDALLHPARELIGELVAGVLEPDELQHLFRPGKALRLRHALHLEAEGDVVDHAPVGEQAEVLEDHRDRVAAQLAQLGAARRHHVASVDLDRARSRLDQPDQRPHERRLARAGEAHDDEDLAGPDLDRDVPDGDHAARLGAQLAARQVDVLGAEQPLAVRAEDLPDPLARESAVARRETRAGPQRSSPQSRSDRPLPHRLP